MGNPTTSSTTQVISITDIMNSADPNTTGLYGSGSQIPDGNKTQGNDFIAQTQPDAGVPSSATQKKPDTTMEGGYGTNKAGDSFSPANQTGAADIPPASIKGQFEK